ncbi:hypothetical protein [Nitrogeniibacter aestuarii]|uniref:hypothetical protein n=1 Tax=Nitrogeniibacter aestuarii TaxID=2815343 RepID=UPI001E60697D|nr:hypothetical protein [Nitrogeniibacter aestuarii]
MKHLRAAVKTLIVPLSLSLWAGASLAETPKNDYPTITRVEYVVACMRDAPKASQEYMYKCSCVVDKIAEQLDYDEFVKESTTSNAISIGGERGEVMRGLKGGRQLARTFHGIENEARKNCFMKPK